MPAADIPMFSGDPDDATKADTISSKTFMKKIHIQLRSDQITGDKDKIAALEDYLKENSPAEKWYHATTTGANPPVTWKQMEAAFVTRFPTPQEAERTPQEYERELLGMKLKVEELDTTVMVGGSQVFTHVQYASRLLELAKLAGIATTASGIWQARDSMPEVIREKVSATQKDWTAFTDAIKGIDCVHIREGAAKAKKNQEIERTVRELATRDKTRQTPMTPVSKMSAQLAQAGLATPRANTALPTTNPFGAGGGRGNLFMQTPNPTELTAEELTKLKEVAEKLGRALLRDDAQGRAEYARRVTIWETVYAGAQPRLELVGYPLSPGTVAPGSGECFSCRKITTPRHRSSECAAAKIPRKESTFRGLVNKYITPVQVNAVADWIDFEDTAEEDFAEGSSE
jgi:hypothetical protein